MSFLNDLKSQARAVQGERQQQSAALGQSTAATEEACRFLLSYLEDLARQLNVLELAAPAFSLDGKVAWPAMKLIDFRVDSRKKMVLGKEQFDYVAMGWQVVPQVGKPVGGVVTVNFPPDLQRVESRLSFGMVQHERKDVRDPDSNILRAYRFEYLTHTRGNVVATADQEKGQIHFRLVNTTGFDLSNITLPIHQVKADMLDELAKRIVSQPSRFA